MADDIVLRCADHDACVWGHICPPGRCLVAETSGSPNYARFAPRAESSDRERGGRERSSQPRCPGRLENRGAFLWPGWRALVLDILPSLFGGAMAVAGLCWLALVLGRFLGVI